MKRARWLIVVALIPAAAMAGPVTQPGDVDVAGLVRKVRADESWVDRAKSLHLILDCKIKYSNTSLPVGLKGLETAADEVLELAFDQSRIYKRQERDVNGPMPYSETDFWDGHESMSYGANSGPVGHPVLAYHRAKNPDSWTPIFFASLPWLRAAPHEIWWMHTRTGIPDVFRPAEEYVVAGHETVRDHACYVLYDCRDPFGALDIGVDDHRLYGVIDRIVGKDNQAALRQIEMETARNLGADLSTFRDVYGMEDSLSPSRKVEFWREVSKWAYALTARDTAFSYDNYKEIAPDCWMPMLMTQENGGQVGRGKGAVMTMNVTLAEKDQPLPEKLFKVEMQEGAIVGDARYFPTLRYNYRKDMTPADFAALLTEARENLMGRMEKVPSSYVALGKPASPFRRGQWLNSQPLDWADFAGRVVLVHFWAEWDAPSLDNLPALEKEADVVDQDSVAVIGVHPPGSETADIQRAMEKAGLTFPVYIDSEPIYGMAIMIEAGGDPRPQSRPECWGWLCDKFGVRGIPDNFVVDKDGTIVAHGELEPMIEQARALAAKQ